MWDFGNKILENKDSLTIDGPDAFELQNIGDLGDLELPPGADPDIPIGEDPSLIPPEYPGEVNTGGGGDLEPDVASGLDPSIIAKLPAWLQQQLRNGNLSPTTAANLIRQFVPNFKIPDGSDPTNKPTGNSDAMNPAMLAAAMATAYNHYRDSDRYTSMAERYTDRLDPFGKERGGYQDQLRNLMTNPEEYLKNDPAYKSMLRLSVDPAMSKMRARGYGNSGNILSELTRLSGDVTNKYVGDLRKDLGNFAGAQFGPGAAAGLLNTGLQGSINSRNAALGDIFAGLRGSGALGSDGTGMNWINALINAFSGKPNNTGDGSAPVTTLPGEGEFPVGFPGFNGDPAPNDTGGQPANVGSGEDNVLDRTTGGIPKIMQPLNKVRYGY